MSFSIFFIAVFTVYFLVHWFVYLQICNDLSLTRKSRLALKVILFLAGSLFILTRIHAHKGFLLFYLSFIGEVWFGIIFIVWTVFFFKFIIGLFYKQNKKYHTIYSLVISILLIIYSIYNGMQDPRLVTFTIKSNKIARNISIVQISDLHIWKGLSEDQLSRMVDTINSLDADLVLATGDIVDTKIEANNQASILKNIKAKLGKYAVLGNHEYYIGEETAKEFIKNSDLQLLVNEKLVVDNFLEIAGDDELTHRRYGGEGPNREKSMANDDPAKFTILMSHRPDEFEDAVDRGADLMLSGHTHAGQIPPLDIIIRFIYDYPYGLYRYKNSYIYTTCGTGTWGPKMRTFSKSEIVLINIIKE